MWSRRCQCSYRTISSPLSRHLETCIRVEAVLPLAGWYSCGGLSERVAWTALRRCAGEDGSHCKLIERAWELGEMGLEVESGI